MQGKTKSQYKFHLYLFEYLSWVEGAPRGRVGGGTDPTADLNVQPTFPENKT